MSWSQRNLQKRDAKPKDVQALPGRRKTMYEKAVGWQQFIAEFDETGNAGRIK